MPFLYRSVGCRLEVVTTTQPCAIRDSISRRRIMASATSVHWNSSKHRTELSVAMSAATYGMASML